MALIENWLRARIRRSQRHLIAQLHIELEKQPELVRSITRLQVQMRADYALMTTRQVSGATTRLTPPQSEHMI